MKKIYLIVFLFYLCSNTVYSTPDDILVHNISEVLIKEYDNYKDKSFSERFVLSLGKKAFIESVKNWEINYKNLSNMPIKLHPQIEIILAKSEKSLDNDTQNQFRGLFVSLTRIAYDNLQDYYNSLKDSLGNDLTKPITITMIDDALSCQKFYDIRLKSFETEENVKQNIRKIFKDERVKFKLSFYLFVFDYFDGIRVNVVKQYLLKTEKNVKEKNR